MQRYILPFALCLIACSGFGSSPVYFAGVGLLLPLLVLETWQDNRKAAFSCILVTAAILAEPSLAYSTSLLTLLLFISSRKAAAGGLLLSHLPLLLSPCTPLPAWFISPYLGGILLGAFALLAWREPHAARVAVTASCSVYGLALLWAAAAS